MMKFLKFSGWTLLVLLMTCLIGAGLLMGLAQEGLTQSGALHGNWQVLVDGDTVVNAHTLRDVWASDEWSGFEAFFGIAIGLFCLLLVLPLVLLFGVGLPLLLVLVCLGTVVASLLGVAALLSAPLLLPFLLLIWILRRKPKVAA